MKAEYYEIDFNTSCPKCGHNEIRYYRCMQPECIDGLIDESDEDFLTEGSVMVPCSECKGTGVVKWCPNCGADLTGVVNLSDDDEYNYDDEDFY